LKLYDEVSACVTPCRPDGAHDGLCARAHKANRLDRRHKLAYLLCQNHLFFGGGAEACALFGGVDYGVDNFLFAVSEEQRTPGADIVYILVAVGVIYLAALAPLDKGGIEPHRAVGSHRAVYTAGDMFLSSFKELFAFLSHVFSPL